MTSQAPAYDVESLKRALSKHDENVKNIGVVIEREKDAITQAEVVRRHLEGLLREDPSLGGWKHELETVNNNILKIEEGIDNLRNEIVEELVRKKETERLIREVEDVGKN